MEIKTSASAPDAEGQIEQGQWLIVVATGLLAAAVAALGMMSPLLAI